MKNFIHLFLNITGLFLATTVTAQNQLLTASQGQMLTKTVVAMNNTPVSTDLTAKETAPVETKDFRGMVVDELGEPLAGAVVSVIAGKNKFSVTTTTNAEGEYVLHSLVAAPLLLVTYAGYTDIQQKATYAQPITFQLEPIDNYERLLNKQVRTAEKAWRK